jgi:hypothetical protein
LDWPGYSANRGKHLQGRVFNQFPLKVTIKMKYLNFSRFSLTVICVLITISNFVVRPNLALAYVASGQLAFVRQVIVNGNNAMSGQTVFSGNKIKVGNKGTAIVNLGKLGRIELGANSELTLLLGENSIGGTLASGCMTVNAPAGVTVGAVTAKGKIESLGNQPTSFFLGIKDAAVNAYPNLGEINATVGNKSEIARPGQMAVIKGEGNGNSKLEILANGVCGDSGVMCACNVESVPETNTPPSSGSPKPPAVANGNSLSVGVVAILLGTVGASTAAILGLTGSSGSGLTCVNGVGLLCPPASPTVP